MIFFAALALAIWIFLLWGHGNFWQGGPVLEPVTPRLTDSVTIIVPARNEAQSITRCLRSLLAQNYAGPFRVILVDDNSSDGTGDLAREVQDNRLQVLTGAKHPIGWSGKLWALSQGVALADSKYLFLTDADIEHEPGHLTALVAKAERDGLSLVSEMVALNCVSWAERALVPAFVFFFQLLYPFDQVNSPGSRTAAAAGGTILIRSDALARIGGLDSMRSALIDDVTLATRVKEFGKIYLGHSLLATSIRPYPNAAEIWRMIARTAYVQLRFSPYWLAGTVAGMILIWLVPPACAVWGHGLTRLAGWLSWAAMTYAYTPTLRRFGLSLAWAPWLPLVAVFYTAATIGSAVDHYRGRGVIWKQRAYIT